ncbi:tetratricopeptide repeat domain 3 [Rhinolophus ferrumequinum]|uniref:Tetratricopeptide repeat domain 3 n=1 Tax=Rhinolophus ferrumequinum TaxID=59479 RepID=A0A7J8AH41_RHIFE|nr:tetratricopeptide repeat domain 3 [Rhinolophus ferrumequinum]
MIKLTRIFYKEFVLPPTVKVSFLRLSSSAVVVKLNVNLNTRS